MESSLKKYILIISILIFSVSNTGYGMILKKDGTGFINLTDTSSLISFDSIYYNTSDSASSLFTNLGAGVSVIFTSILHFSGIKGSLFTANSAPNTQNQGFTNSTTSIQDRTIFDLTILASVLGFSSSHDYFRKKNNLFAIIPVNPISPAITPYMEKTGPNLLARQKMGIYLYYSRDF